MLILSTCLITDNNCKKTKNIITTLIEQPITELTRHQRHTYITTYCDKLQNQWHRYDDHSVFVIQKKLNEKYKQLLTN